MDVLFQNHSSLLIKYSDRYLLTDPWYNQPAFGSWLPTFAPYIHPSYLAALGTKLTILISHGHDDHFDDRLLEIFDKKTHIITADFKSPSVINRIKKLGFTNITPVGEDEQEIDGLLISSYILEEFSHDDAAYLIRNDEGAVIHANDNWHIFDARHESLLVERTSSYDKSSVLLFSQSNSASGYPLNYRNFSEAEKISLLKSKVAKMVQGGLQNAESLGLNKMYSYAGFATPYVKNKNYHELGLFPTARYLGELLDEESVKSSVEVAELYPGDSVSLPGGMTSKAFINGYEDERIKTATDAFYRTYGNIDECISFRDTGSGGAQIDEWIDEFLIEFNAFTERRVNGPDPHYTDLIGKTFSIEVTVSDATAIRKTIQFGTGLVEWNDKANKMCFVDAPVMLEILKGNALFEDLYTGYNAEWERNPSKIYNRDVVMMIVMYSYVYKNRLSQTMCSKYL